MLKTKGFIYNLLNGNTDLIAIVGLGHVVNAYPSAVETWPLVIVLDDSQSDTEYADNVPRAASVSVVVHIFTKSDISYPTSTTIGIAVDAAMKTSFFSTVSNGEVSDPVDGVIHRVMKYTRAMYPSEF